MIENQQDELLDIQIRYRSAPVPGRLVHDEGKRVRFEFVSPVKAVTPGQTLVVYRGDEVLGGGVIAERLSRMPMAS